MSDPPGLHIRTLQAWRFHPAGGLPKHGPTLDKPQTKAWYALGSWWALLVRPEQGERPELAIFELVGHEWRDSGAVVANDPRSTADAYFDGVNLWVATRAPGVGIALLRYRPDVVTRTWRADPAGAWRARGIESPSVSVARSLDGTIWLHFTSEALPWYVCGPADRFPHLGDPRPVPGATATLIDVDLGALVAMEEAMGLMWSDQGTETLYFALAGSDGRWWIEEAASGGLVADDHIALRRLDGRLFAAVKTSKDNDPCGSAADPLIALLVREPDGRWHLHKVVDVTEPATRPIPLVDPERGLVHVLYTYGPNPGERSIRVKSATLDGLEFAPGPGEVVLGAPGAEINDVTSSREPLSAERPALVLGSDGANCRYYACLLAPSGFPRD